MTSHAGRSDWGNTASEQDYLASHGKALDENDIVKIQVLPESISNRVQTDRRPYAPMAHPRDLLAFERQVQRLQGAITHLRTELRAAESQCHSMAEVARATIASVGYPAEGTLTKLTRQEAHVALWAAHGAADAEIAASLGLSVNTIKSHMKAILQKLGMHSRWELRHVMLGGPQGDLLPTRMQDHSRRDGIAFGDPP